MTERGLQTSALALIGAGLVALYALALADPAVGTTAVAPGAAIGTAADVPARPPVAAALRMPPTPEPQPRAAPSAPVQVSTLALPIRPRPAPRYIDVAAAETLTALHDEIGFSLAAVRQGEAPVPRLLVADLPDDFNSGDDVKARKAAFLRTTLPLILAANERLLADRRELDRLVTKQVNGGRLDWTERRWLARLADRFETTPDDLVELQRRVDAVSPAVALAQGAEESGWGRSRFARDGNALFGQRTWTAGAGIVPKERENGARYEVKAFTFLADSARAYAMNLNTHPAYAEYRRLRAAARAAGRVPDATALAATLDRYSERRDEYVATIQTILRANKFDQFDTAQLSRATPAVQVAQRPGR